MIPALPQFILPPALAESIRIGLEKGPPYPLLDLETQMPSLGPYIMDSGGMFKTLVYTGPTMRFETIPSLGRNLNVQA